MDDIARFEENRFIGVRSYGFNDKVETIRHIELLGVNDFPIELGGFCIICRGILLLFELPFLFEPFGVWSIGVCACACRIKCRIFICGSVDQVCMEFDFIARVGVLFGVAAGHRVGYVILNAFD